MLSIVKHIIFYCLSAWLLLSCTKVVDVGLNDAASQIVIEGSIDNQPGADTVIVSTTVNFSASNRVPSVSGAVVSVSDNLGNIEILKEVIPGKYIIQSIQGVPGQSYTLSVSLGDKIYTAESTMPFPVSLDTLIVQDAAGLGETNYQVFPVFKDPAGISNYYRFKEYVNGKRVSGSFLFDDKLIDGLYNTRPLRNFGDDGNIESGGLIIVEMYCIDEPVYTYFFSLSQNSNGQTTAPANPVSNISNGALGYFSAHTVERKTVAVP